MITPHFGNGSAGNSCIEMVGTQGRGWPLLSKEKQKEILTLGFLKLLLLTHSNMCAALLIGMGECYRSVVGTFLLNRSRILFFPLV